VKLPNAESAVADIAKLRDYALSATHPVGKHNARVNASVLGLTAADAEYLRNFLLEAARMLDATSGGTDEHGQRYVIDSIIVGPSGQSTLRSSWIVRAGEDFPRLVPCFVL
jgi:hypothetical protein